VRPRHPKDTSVNTPISFLSVGCTASLDSSIAEQRVRYAGERVDFHDYFDVLTVADIQRILRGGTALVDKYATRKEVVVRLLEAQRGSPHALWTLLLLQAFEAELVERRKALSTRESATLDSFLLLTFLDALQSIPSWLEEDEVRKHVLTESKVRLNGAIKKLGGVTKILIQDSGLVVVPSASANTNPSEVA